VTIEQHASRRRGPRGPYAKSRATQGSILDAALEVFGQAGFRSGSLRAVAERVGISEAGLLHHFKNKATLLRSVLEHRDAESLRMFDFGRPGGDVLRAMLELADYNETNPGIVELFGVVSAEATDPEHPAHEFFRDRYINTRQTIAESFAQLRSEGRLRPEVDPEDAARDLIAMWDGLQIQWLYHRGSFRIADELRRFIDAQLVAPLDSDGAQSSEPR